MGGSGLLSEDDQEASRKTATEIFNDRFPFYLSIGMSSAEYWTGDVMLARYFREAFQLKQEQQDYSAWLQGLYFYEALSVSLTNAFQDKRKPPQKYTPEPYLQRDKKEQQALSENPEGKPDKFVLWMNSIVRNTSNTKRGVRSE